MGSLQQDQPQGRRRGPETMTRRAYDGCLVVDMERLSLLVDGGINCAAASSNETAKTLSRKTSKKEDRKEAAAADSHLSTGGGGSRGSAAFPSTAAAPEKSVAVFLAAAPEATDAAGGSPRQTKSYGRAHGKRGAASPWPHPRRVLIFFATLSSMGTFILLYFTLSMGKMVDGNVDAQ